jgi:hypothetical protein
LRKRQSYVPPGDLAGLRRTNEWKTALPGTNTCGKVRQAREEESMPACITWQIQSGNFSQKASVSMSTQSNPVVAGTKVVDAEPGKTQAEVKIGLGGILEFRNHSHEFPYFEIEFYEPGPPCASDKLTGTTDEPVFVHMPETDAVFTYCILYKKKHGTHIHRDGVFKAHSCPGC